MFTWRELQENKKISSFYINNILNLLNNEELINNLSKQNITLYFTLHHQLHKYRKKFKDISNIKYIEENDIADCLSKTNLLVSDYSSIIFDMIYRQKPYIIFIPDAYDPNLYKIYKKNCYIWGPFISIDRSGYLICYIMKNNYSIFLKKW
jgi:CDP-glycerol glycerophosphotransferase (TagB/SpsB family)